MLLGVRNLIFCFVTEVQIMCSFWRQISAVLWSNNCRRQNNLLNFSFFGRAVLLVFFRNHISIWSLKLVLSFYKFVTRFAFCWCAGNLLRSGDIRGYQSMARMYTRLAAMPKKGWSLKWFAICHLCFRKPSQFVNMDHEDHDNLLLYCWYLSCWQMVFTFH